MITTLKFKGINGIGDITYNIDTSFTDILP